MASDIALETKIGTMLAYGWTGETREEQTTVSEHAREIVEDMQVGAIVLLSRNIADDLTLTANTYNELQALSREPLLIIADQEGGMVARFVDGVTVMPSNMSLGATGDPGLGYRAASAVASELRAIGVNFNFAPCVDVNNNPDNPIIGTRSYGESPENVVEFASQAIRGFQDQGVIACAKHFPGHGDTSVDSHIALPAVPYARERLEAVELKPFVGAIAAGVSSMMTTHIMFPAFDPDLPATISHRIITGLLRDQLGYDGVVVTDCMEMKALADNWGTVEACLMAIEAGVDLLLVCHTRATQAQVREAIVKAVKDGRISEDRIDQSVRRIRALKAKYSLNSRRTTDPAALAGILRSPANLAVQREVAERSVTLVKNEDSILPLKLDSEDTVLVMGLHHSVPALGEAVGALWAKTSVLHIQGGDDDEIIASAVEAASAADVIIVPTCPLEPWRSPVNQELQARMVKSISELGKRLVVVAVREPYDLRRFPQVRTYVCSYGYRGASLEAAAALIFGKIEPKGTLPVTIPEDAPEEVDTRRSDLPEYF